MAWQYCENCDAELNPTTEDILRRRMLCTCGLIAPIIETEDVREELIIEMYNDIQRLKEK